MNSTHPSYLLSLAMARNLALYKQGLACRPPGSDKGTLLALLRQIGLLQLDTINVVARSHYLVLLSRAGLYAPADLDALLYPDRALFEQWAHAACLIPTEDYGYFAPVIMARRARRSGRLGRLGASPEEVLTAVLARVAQEGPLRSVDFADTRPQAGTWWDWKPAKIALEILFEEGYLMIDRRVNFQRYYDLAERVLPGSGEPPAFTVDDWRRWATLRSIGCLGAGTAVQIADYYRQLRLPMQHTLQALLAEGLVVAVEVEGWREPAYMCAADLPLLEAIASGAHAPTLTALLSPFDNLIWHRQRAHDLFDFDYRIEVYNSLVRQGRRYGYYVMPILHRGRLVGRVDPKADRRSKTLLVHTVYLEPGQEPADELAAALAATLREFAEFHGLDSVSLTRSDPPALRELLLRHL